MLLLADEMLATSVLLYTLSATFLANIFAIFRTPAALRHLWQAFFVASRHKANPLSVGELFPQQIPSVTGVA